MGAQDLTGEGKAETAAGPRRVRSAERVVAVLDILRQSSRPLRHSEVAAILSLPKSSVSNLLDTLTDTGLITRDERGYSLGVKLIELGYAAAERLDIRAVARPVMEELCRLGVGTCNLAILRGHDVLYIEKISDPSHLIQLVTSVGGLLPAHATALGKVLVANLPPAVKRDWLRDHEYVRFQRNTAASASRFKQDLKAYEQHGYAVDDEESHLNVMCLAAPIFDHSQQVVAAMSLTRLKADVQKDGIAQTAAALLDAATRVSKMLGASQVPDEPRQSGMP
jgi:DNA-binding IclR family transcriptional regulator